MQSLTEYCLEVYQKHNGKYVDLEIFKQEFFKFTLTQKMLRKIAEGKESNFRLILNNIITLFNVFHEDTNSILLDRLDPSILPQIKPILIFLNRMPPSFIVTTYTGMTIDFSQIQHCPIVTELIIKEAKL